VIGRITGTNTITFSVDFHPVDSCTTWIGFFDMEKKEIDTTWLLKKSNNNFDSLLTGHDLFKVIEEPNQ
jgi:hypothetical protein